MAFRPRRLLVAALAATVATTMLARSGFTWEELNVIDQRWPQAQKTTTGLRYVVQQEGHGDRPKPGDSVSVLYRGLFFDGSSFAESLDRTHPFTFRLGRGQIIEGWEEGISMMRVGEKRILIVPYDLAYGSRGQPPRIPRQTSLVFEVEVLAIEPNPVPPPAATAR